MNPTYDVIVVGAGIFGVTTALELKRRGYDVAILDPGPIPHPLASSTDINKVIRMEYGRDEQYMEMVEEALPVWRRWNEELGETLYHEVGVMAVTQEAMTPDGFEYESFQLLRRRGHTPERLDAGEISRRYPAWAPGVYVDGYFHARGGYAESGRVVLRLSEHAQRKGVDIHIGHTVESVLMENGRVYGVRTRAGETFLAPRIVIAAGTWTPLLVPELQAFIHSVGQPVFHLKPAQPELFSPPAFTVFAPDISRTGWYGFPYHPREGVVKIANHGAGLTLHPEKDERVVAAGYEDRLRRFLEKTFPALAAAPIVFRRLCMYSDTLDEHLWIDRHPQHEGLTVASGGSGHGFKFAPVLGPLIADAVEGKENRWLARFRWRDLTSQTAGQEATRFRG